MLKIEGDGLATHLGSPHDPPAFPHHRFKRTQIRQSIKDESNVEDEFVPLITRILDHTRKPNDLVPPRTTGDESVFQWCFGDDEFGDGGKVDHGGCDEGFGVVRDARGGLSEWRGGSTRVGSESSAGGDGEGSFGDCRGSPSGGTRM
jgi:hypothetical protein